MPTAASLIKRVSKLLTKTNPNSLVVYKRTTVRSGGDPLIGLVGEVTVTDSVMLPQPVLTEPTADGDFVLVADNISPASDYVLLCSVESVSEAELMSPTTCFVLKDSLGAEREALAIVRYKPSSFAGQTIMFKVLVRSKTR